jgi:hypothetical protein
MGEPRPHLTILLPPPVPNIYPLLQDLRMHLIRRAVLLFAWPNHR